MARKLSVSVAIAMVLTALPSRAANRPHAGQDGQHTVWTNDDLEKLHDTGLISIVGQMNDETSEPASLPQPDVITRDPAWYAEQASELRNELERRQAQLAEYLQALEDARSLRETNGGINLEDGNIGITPEAGIEILQQRVSETQTEFDSLEDLARRNDIPPGILRGQGDSGIQTDGLS